MPGFLSEYSTITKVELGGGWWVRVRKFLSRGDFKAAQAKLITPTMKYTEQEQAETTGSVDTGGYQNELVARAIVEWNLTDENDQPIPIGTVHPDNGPDLTRYRAVNVLPGEVFDKLLLAIEGAAPKTKDKLAAKDGETPTDPFPVGSAAGAMEPSAGPAGAIEV